MANEGYGVPQNYTNMRAHQQEFQKNKGNYGYAYGEEYHQNPSFHSKPAQMAPNYHVNYPMGYIPPPMHPSYQNPANMN